MRIMHTLWMLCRPMSTALGLGLCLVSCSSERAERKVAYQKAILGPENAGSLLSQFSEPARRRLEAVLFNERFDGVIGSEVVEDVMRLEGGATTLDHFMVDMLPMARMLFCPCNLSVQSRRCL